MTGPTSDEELLVLQQWFPVHELILSDIQRALGTEQNEEQFHHPKVEDFGRYLFLIMHALVTPEAEITEPATFLRQTKEAQLNIIVGERFLITHHAFDLPAIARVKSVCNRNLQVMERGPDYVLHLILDELVDDYLPLVAMYEDRVEELEHLVFKSTSNLTLIRILEIKRQLQKVRRDVVYQREIINRLARGDFSIISLSESMYYRNVYDHLVRVSDQVDTCRELASSIMEAYFSVSSARLNEVMKRLTLISTIFLPITFITSLYGMNFVFMPELQLPWAYPAVLGLLVVVALIMYLQFKSRGWVD
jgi:magnesium transporter